MIAALWLAGCAQSVFGGRWAECPGRDMLDIALGESPVDWSISEENTFRVERDRANRCEYYTEERGSELSSNPIRPHRDLLTDAVRPFEVRLTEESTQEDGNCSSGNGSGSWDISCGDHLAIVHAARGESYSSSSDYSSTGRFSAGFRFAVDGTASSDENTVTGEGLLSVELTGWPPLERIDLAIARTIEANTLLTLRNMSVGQVVAHVDTGPSDGGTEIPFDPSTTPYSEEQVDLEGLDFDTLELDVVGDRSVDVTLGERFGSATIDLGTEALVKVGYLGDPAAFDTLTITGGVADVWVFLPPGSYDLALTGGATFLHSEIRDGGSSQPAVVVDAGNADIYIGKTDLGYYAP